MSESDLDAMVERIAREEQGELDRKHGQAILDITAAMGSASTPDPLLEVLRQAHQAKAEEDKQQ